MVTDADRYMPLLREIADYFQAEKPMLVSADHTAAMAWALQQLAHFGRTDMALCILESNAYRARELYHQKMNQQTRDTMWAAEELVHKMRAEIAAAEST